MQFWHRDLVLLLGTRSSLDRPITPACVFFVLSRFYFYTLSEYSVIHCMKWYSSSFICQVATDNVPSIVHVAITHMTVCFALSVFFSRIECRVARRPSPMTVCFCTSLSIFFVLSQRNPVSLLLLFISWIRPFCLYNMYREKRIATYRNQTYTEFINERCSGA